MRGWRGRVGLQLPSPSLSFLHIKPPPLTADHQDRLVEEELLLPNLAHVYRSSSLIKPACLLTFNSLPVCGTRVDVLKIRLQFEPG